MIDVTDAMVQALAWHLAQPLPTVLGGLPSVGDLAAIKAGWTDQREEYVLPTVAIDAPVDGERIGRFPTVVSSQRVDANGNPSVDPADFRFKYQIDLAAVTLPLQVTVFAASQAQRAEIDAALTMALVGDLDGDSGLVSLAWPDYYGATFSFEIAGVARYFDSTTTIGRDEWTSIREITAQGCDLVEITAAGFTDLQASLKVTEMGRDFDLVPEESFTVFDPTT